MRQAIVCPATKLGKNLVAAYKQKLDMRYEERR
jgi:hypothetical protein